MGQPTTKERLRARKALLDDVARAETDCRARCEAEVRRLAERRAQLEAEIRSLGGVVVARSREAKKPAAPEKKEVVGPRRPVNKIPVPIEQPLPPESVEITPAALVLASKSGVDVELVAGTGAGGRITVADIRKFL